MITDLLFHFSAATVLPFWFLMILAPKHTITSKLIKSPWIIIPPVICYVIILAINIDASMLSFFKNPSANELALIMQQPWAAALFWIYAGAFDLFVGRWIFLDAKESKLSHKLLAPILVIAIFFGPVAFLLYFFSKMIRNPDRKAVHGTF